MELPRHPLCVEQGHAAVVKHIVVLISRILLLPGRKATSTSYRCGAVTWKLRRA
jgi:hypothetical protein